MESISIRPPSKHSKSQRSDGRQDTKKETTTGSTGGVKEPTDPTDQASESGDQIEQGDGFENFDLQVGLRGIGGLP